MRESDAVYSGIGGYFDIVGSTSPPGQSPGGLVFFVAGIFFALKGSQGISFRIFSKEMTYEP